MGWKVTLPGQSDTSHRHRPRGSLDKESYLRDGLRMASLLTLLALWRGCAGDEIRQFDMQGLGYMHMLCVVG